MWTNIIRVFYYNDNKLILQCRLFLSFSLLLLMPFCCRTLSFVFTTVDRIALFKVCAVNLGTKSHCKKRSSYGRDKVSNRLYFNQAVTIIWVL